MVYVLVYQTLCALKSGCSVLSYKELWYMYLFTKPYVRLNLAVVYSHARNYGL